MLQICKYKLRESYIINIVFFAIDIIEHNIVVYVVSSFFVDFRCITATVAAVNNFAYESLYIKLILLENKTNKYDERVSSSLTANQHTLGYLDAFKQRVQFILVKKVKRVYKKALRRIFYHYGDQNHLVSP